MFSHLLISFANSLQPDQARQNIGPDKYGSKLFDTLMVILKEFFQRVILKILADDKKHENSEGAKS